MDLTLKPKVFVKDKTALRSMASAIGPRILKPSREKRATSQTREEDETFLVVSLMELIFVDYYSIITDAENENQQPVFIENTRKVKFGNTYIRYFCDTSSHAEMYLNNVVMMNKQDPQEREGTGCIMISTTTTRTISSRFRFVANTLIMVMIIIIIIKEGRKFEICSDEGEYDEDDMQEGLIDDDSLPSWMHEAIAGKGGKHRHASFGISLPSEFEVEEDMDDESEGNDDMLPHWMNERGLSAYASLSPTPLWIKEIVATVGSGI